LLDVKNRVRDLSLRKNDLILPIFGYRFSLAHFGEKLFRIERGLASFPHKDSPVLPEQKLLSPDEDSANPNYFSNSNAKMNLFKKPQPSPVSLRGAMSGMS